METLQMKMDNFEKKNQSKSDSVFQALQEIKKNAELFFKKF